MGIGVLGGEGGQRGGLMLWGRGGLGSLLSHIQSESTTSA